MLDKRKIQVIFLFELKMSHKAPAITRNINNAFGSGTANKYTVHWRFKKFCEGDESLEVGESSGWPLELDNDQLGGSSKLILLQLYEKLPKNSTWTILSQDPWLQCVGSSSLTRDWTWGPCIARQILNHWITRQVASLVSLSWKYSPSSSIYTMLYLYLSYDSQFFLLHIFVNMYAHVLYPFWSVSS